MIAISFLGLGKKKKETGVFEYEHTKYEYGGRIVETCYFPYAVKEFTKPEKLAVIMTEKARTAHSDRLREKCEYETIIIPEGKTEKEIWEIFGEISDYVPENAEIILDITHGFRSQPVILLACLIYLKALKNVKLLQILYAAFEARDENNVTPVFDLKPFLDLMDWSYGVYEFVNNGNSKEFRKLLSEAHKSGDRFETRIKAQKLGAAGLFLEGLSNAMSIVNVNDTLINAEKFKKVLPEITTDTENINKAKPFGMLLDKVKQRVDKLGKPYTEKEGERFIESNLEILKWYIETEQYQQAATIMREVFVTANCINIGVNPYEKGKREEIEYKINSNIKKLQAGEQISSEETKEANLFNNLGILRNGINHAGMNKEGLKINGTNQIKRIIKYFTELEEYIKKLTLDADKSDESSV